MVENVTNKPMTDFDLENFLPYLLNRASEEASIEFSAYYKATYGMLRTEWRVLFHLGRWGEMSARDITTRSRIHKTKISRAVKALEQKRFLRRMTDDLDRRREVLSLTAHGKRTYADLMGRAQAFDAKLMRGFTPQEQTQLRSLLRRLSD